MRFTLFGPQPPWLEISSSQTTRKGGLVAAAEFNTPRVLRHGAGFGRLRRFRASVAAFTRLIRAHAQDRKDEKAFKLAARAFCPARFFVTLARRIRQKRGRHVANPHMRSCTRGSRSRPPGFWVRPGFPGTGRTAAASCGGCSGVVSIAWPPLCHCSPPESSSAEPLGNGVAQPVLRSSSGILRRVAPELDRLGHKDSSADACSAAISPGGARRITSSFLVTRCARPGVQACAEEAHGLARPATGRGRASEAKAATYSAFMFPPVYLHRFSPRTANDEDR